MDFGLHIGTRGPAATGDGLRAIARRAEEAGLAWLGLNDHVVTAAAVDSRYPYSATGVWPAADTGTCLEQITALSHIACGETELLRKWWIIGNNRDCPGIGGTLGVRGGEERPDGPAGKLEIRDAAARKRGKIPQRRAAEKGEKKRGRQASSSQVANISSMRAMSSAERSRKGRAGMAAPPNGRPSPGRASRPNWWVPA